MGDLSYFLVPCFYSFPGAEVPEGLLTPQIPWLIKQVYSQGKPARFPSSLI